MMSKQFKYKLSADVTIPLLPAVSGIQTFSVKKMKRKHVEARWRAEIAACYNTLSNVVPASTKKLTKRLAKTVILEETSKHINFLESLISSLLKEKAERMKVRNASSWCCEQWKGIHQAYKLKQTLSLAPNGKQKPRRLTNPPSRMQREQLSVLVENADHFTPVKLPITWCSDTFDLTLPMTEETAGKGFDLKSTGVQSCNESQTTLVCDELMWMSDDELENGGDRSLKWNPATPRKEKINKCDDEHTGITVRCSKRATAMNSSLTRFSKESQVYQNSSGRDNIRSSTLKCRRSLNMGGSVSYDSNAITRRCAQSSIAFQPLYTYQDSTCLERFSSSTNDGNNGKSYSNLREELSSGDLHVGPVEDVVTQERTMSSLAKTAVAVDHKRYPEIVDATKLVPCISLSQPEDVLADYWLISYDFGYCPQRLEDDMEEQEEDKNMTSLKDGIPDMHCSHLNTTAIEQPKFNDVLLSSTAICESDDIAEMCPTSVTSISVNSMSDDEKNNWYLVTPEKRTRFIGQYSPLFGHGRLLFA